MQKSAFKQTADTKGKRWELSSPSDMFVPFGLQWVEQQNN